MLKNISKLLAPFAPFAAEDIWQMLRSEGDTLSVHLANWPDQKPTDPKISDDMQSVRELVTTGLELRQKSGVKVRQPLASLTINKDLSPEYQELLKDELNIKEVVVGETVSLNTEITPLLKREGDFREFLRSVQAARKDAGLEAQDVVNLNIREDSKSIISGFETELRKVAGVNEISFASDLEKEFEIVKQ